ncbi:MAG: M23 family metallopeptidase [Epsilonproteobacteria bacterium]|nr:peptidase M23 [Campylobacterota bacterium]NPA56712.1 M23 family metallopeptidase [Campylobacterota bacterium]
MYTSTAFEREAPIVEVADEIYWNLKEPIRVSLRDNTGIKSYKITIFNGSKEKIIDMQKLEQPKRELNLSIAVPVDMEFPKGRAELLIEVQDKSYWNYFLGNKSLKRSKIYIDTKKPDLYVVNNSYAITKGGSALVIFHCRDENLKDFYIRTNFGIRFRAAPFYKDGYYVALVAWPITQSKFKATIVALDKAGNRAKAHIPFYLKNRRYRTSKIELKDSFLDGKVAELAEDYPETRSMDRIERFKFVNEKLRMMNEQLIHTIAQKVPQERVTQFKIKAFYPLKNGAKVADFGDHRYYYYRGRLVSEAYHMGLDLASTKMADIIASNPGKVVFSDYNGIYGNMPMISHGLGLYTLYAHCSSVFVRKGDSVSRGKRIAKTGRTGLVLGDHLHFGVVVQGVEVRPEEWMDRRWIKLNIEDIIEDAKKLIDSK